MPRMDVKNYLIIGGLAYIAYMAYQKMLATKPITVSDLSIPLPARLPTNTQPLVMMAGRR